MTLNDVAVRIGTLGIALLLSAGAVSCKDAAEPDYKKCIELEGQGKLDEALAACHAAYVADKSSRYGDLASKEEIKLLDMIKEKRDQAVKRDADSDDREKVNDAESKVQFVLEATPMKDKGGMSEQCMAKDRAFENAYSCTPKDPDSAPAGEGVPYLEECKLLASRRGCKFLTPEAPSKLFCCTK
jgi:hypothetical protein